MGLRAHMPGKLTFRPLTPRYMNDLSEVLRGSWGSGCWCMYPRLTEKQTRELPGEGTLSARKCDAMTKLARRRRAPGLLAFLGDDPAGWVAVAPREEFARVDASRATPRVDDVNVWIIPCVTVRKTERGNGIADELIRAAVDYAAQNGAPAVEAYPRAGDKRNEADNLFFGTETMFRRAGFRVVRKPPKNLPRNWVPRVTMRTTF